MMPFLIFLALPCATLPSHSFSLPYIFIVTLRLCFINTPMFHQYSTTFTFPLLKNITKHLLIIQHMVIHSSFIYESPALHKYASALSFSKSSKFLILQFLVKCCKLHSIFKFFSKSHMLDIFSISIVYYKCSYKL